jgi:hypothetical protein
MPTQLRRGFAAGEGVDKKLQSQAVEPEIVLDAMEAPAVAGRKMARTANVMRKLESKPKKPEDRSLLRSRSADAELSQEVLAEADDDHFMEDETAGARRPQPARRKRARQVKMEFWEPYVVTDESGEATITFTLADVDTKYHIRIDAHSDGRIGSIQGEIVIRSSAP